MFLKFKYGGASQEAPMFSFGREKSGCARSWDNL